MPEAFFNVVWRHPQEKSHGDDKLNLACSAPNHDRYRQQFPDMLV
ncbi:hypothetical protein DDI_0463 [Dickeya dianthicola RNS04.9]|nr:hypothetical protein DDI_0463 [Dickeya dianthicola RNS04.9]